MLFRFKNTINLSRAPTDIRDSHCSRLAVVACVTLLSSALSKLPFAATTYDYARNLLVLETAIIVSELSLPIRGDAMRRQGSRIDASSASDHSYRMPQLRLG
jgi:hypothetical protein